jgi:uncharacterized protein (DUF1778 family)
MVKKKKKMGRPPMNPKERRCCKIDIRFTAAEKLALTQAAKAAGTCVSRYVIMLMEKKDR